MNFGFECFRKLFCCFPKIYGWGNNTEGQLALDSKESKTEMSLVGTKPPTITKQSDWIKVCSAGGRRGYGILADGTLWGWGESPVGDGTAEERSHAVQIGEGQKWKDVSGSETHTIAIRDDGTLWAWGRNESDQLGHELGAPPSLADSEHPVRAKLSRPITAADVVNTTSSWQKGGKYSEKPTANVVAMHRDEITSAWVQSPSGIGATADPVMNFTVKSVDVTDGGEGYTSPPNVTLAEDGDGVQSPTERSLSVWRLGVPGGGTGSGYKSPPIVRFIGEATSPASAVVETMLCVVKSITIVDGGSGYATTHGTGEVSMSISLPHSPSYSAAYLGLAQINGTDSVQSATVPSYRIWGAMPGEYEVTLEEPRAAGGRRAKAIAVLEGDAVLEIRVVDGGRGYKTTPSVEFIPTNGGSGATAIPFVTSSDRVGSGNAVLTPVMSFKVVELLLASGGSGYTSKPTVTITGSGEGAAGEVSKMGVVIEEINMTLPGGGYTSPPAVTINGTASQGAVAVLSNGTVVSVVVAPGLKVDSETVAIGFQGGGGTGAAATAKTQLNHVLEVKVTSKGSKYKSAPKVSFSGPGYGASAAARVGEGIVDSVNVDVAHEATAFKADGYKEKPSVVFSGGGSTRDAEATAKAEGVVESVEIIHEGSGYTKRRFSNSEENSQLREVPFVFFERDSQDEFSDGTKTPAQSGNYYWFPPVGANEALAVCRLEPGPVDSLTISSKYSGPGELENPPFPKQTFGRVKKDTTVSSMGRTLISGTSTITISLAVGSRSEELSVTGIHTAKATSDSDGWPCDPWVVISETVEAETVENTTKCATLQVFPLCTPTIAAYPNQAPFIDKNIVKLAVSPSAWQTVFGVPSVTSCEVSFSASDAEVEVKLVDGQPVFIPRKVGQVHVDTPVPITSTTSAESPAKTVKSTLRSDFIPYGNDVRVAIDGPPGPVPVYDLLFIATSGADAKGTVSSPEGWLASAVLEKAGMGYSEEPIVRIDGTGASFCKPRQVGAGKWKSVTAGSSYSLGVSLEGHAYWWGGVPRVGRIRRPTRVGKRPHVSATPTQGEDSPPVYNPCWIAPPDGDGVAAATGWASRLLKASKPPMLWENNAVNEVSGVGTFVGAATYTGDPYLNPRYEGDYVVPMHGGCGYTSPPSTLPHTNTAAVSLTLVGPDAVASLSAVGEDVVAKDAAGVAWRLNAPEAMRGTPIEQKNRKALFTETATYTLASKSFNFVRTSVFASLSRSYVIDDRPGGRYQRPNGYFYLKSGGSGYSQNLNLKYSGQRACWRITKTETVYTYTDCVQDATHLQSVMRTDTIHSAGEIVLPEFTKNPNETPRLDWRMEVWQGSVVGPFLVWPHRENMTEFLEQVPAQPPNTDVTDGLVRTVCTYSRELFPTTYGTLSVVDEEGSGSGAVYELVPELLVHGGTGIARIGGTEPVEEITDVGIARSNSGKLFYNFGRVSYNIPGVFFPQQQQKRYLRTAGEAGVLESDQTLWYLGNELLSPPVSKGDIELIIDDEGEGYTEPAIFKFSEQPSGVATASATLNAKVFSVGVTRGGSGYRSPPVVSFASGAGGGAAATAAIAGPVESVSVTSGGSGYRTPPKVVFSQPGISGRATATIKDGAVTAVAVSDGGRYRSSPTVSFEPVPDVEAIDLTNGGSGYSSPPRVLVAGGSGSGCEATCSIDGRLTAVTLLFGGSQFKSPPDVSFVGGGGQGASAIAGINSETGEVSGITILSPGSGYQSPPAVVISGGEGTGASAVAAIAGPVRDVTLRARGAGYDRPPLIFFQGGGGINAAATARTAAPGAGAAATCKINGSVIYCTVTNQGSGYKSPPDVTISGGGNEALQSLDVRLQEGLITQAEYDELVGDYKAAAQARIEGDVSLSVDNGGDKYAYKYGSGTPDRVWDNARRYLVTQGEPYANEWKWLPYWRSGEMIQPRFWVHDAAGRDRQEPAAKTKVVTSNDVYKPYLIATPESNNYPGSPIQSMNRPQDVPAVVNDTSPSVKLTGRKQTPLVSFWNTHALRSSTDLLLAGVARRYGESAKKKDVISWPHSLQSLSLFISSQEIAFDGFRHTTGRSALGHLLTEVSVKDGEASVWCVGFVSGGEVDKIYLDGVRGLSPIDGYTHTDGSPYTEDKFLYKFSSPPSVAIECDIGTGASASVAVDGGGLGTASVSSRGSGYGSLARAVVSGGRPLITPASATASIRNGAVTSISVNSQGDGYTSPPRVVIHGGGGEGAEAVVVMSDDEGIRQKVVAVVVTSSGSNYTSAPLVAFVQTDKDYADFVYPFSGYREIDGFGEPAGYKSRFVSLENAVPEYYELLDREKRFLMSSLPQSEAANDRIIGKSGSVLVESFFSDGRVIDVTVDASYITHSPEFNPPLYNQYGERHASCLSRLPLSATVTALGKCKAPSEVSLVRPKWSNELHGSDTRYTNYVSQFYWWLQRASTFAVRDTTQ